MESSLAFLCFWVCFIVYVSTTNGCSEIPVLENAEVAESSKKPHYSDGDSLSYNCVHGYVSRIKIIYKCTNNEWKIFRGENCSLKRCESPEDIPNGRYIIESGKSFFFGTTIKYICNDGYQIMSRFDTRTCRDGGWDNQLPACEEVSCERKTTEGNIRVEGLPDNPEDLIRHGHRLTFSCVGSGLKLQGQTEITCQSNGEWSSPFPKCVEVSCERKKPEANVRVEGLPDNPEDLIRHRHRLTFSCVGSKLKLQGQKEVTCQSNGEWSSSFPKCVVEVSCERETTEGNIIVKGLPNHPEDLIRPEQRLTFSCVGSGVNLQGQKEITCQSNGEWSSPFPKCVEVTCEGEQLINVDILTGHPGIVSPYKPGHVLVFRCTDVKLRMQGERAIKCLSNGKWDHPYPKCEEVNCWREQLINVDILTGHPGIVSPYKPGHVLVFDCTDVNLKMHGQRAIECLSNGKWDHPYPKCEEIRCKAPRDQYVYRASEYFRGEKKLGSIQDYHCEPGYEKMAEKAICSRDGWTPNPLCSKRCEVPYYQHVKRLYEHFRGDMKLGTKKYYSCESGYQKMAEEATCTRDGWTPKPLCAAMTVSEKCGPPPQVNNADTVEMTKQEYNTWERVEYICFNKYTLDESQHYTKHLTCQQGQWIGNIRCLKPCTVTKEIMNEKGIELAYVNQQKMFAPHNDHITFACLRGKVSTGIKFRQKCNDGKMTLPECV